ncbi:hypothetical protein BST61_g7725 [Cercospora zeina]
MASTTNSFATGNDTSSDHSELIDDNAISSLARSDDNSGRIVPGEFNAVQSASRQPDDYVTESSITAIKGLSKLASLKERVHGDPEQAKTRLERMCGAVRTLIECVGEEPDREGLLATPLRYAEALLFLTQGYRCEVEKLVNNALFREEHHEMVIVKDIEIYSMCEHHLVPFTGKVHIGYIPNGTVIGLSKLPRIAEMFSRRLQIQERLTKQIAYTINDIVKPKGVGVVMESCHLCMVMRGVEKTGTTTITSCVLGCFDDLKTRNEFLSLVGIGRL